MQDRTLARLPPLFAQALELHRKGHLQAAQSLYEQILEVQPRNFDALHVLGVLAAQMGDCERADRLLARAVQANPSHAAAHNNRGNVLKALKQPGAAVASYDQAIALKPDYADAYYNRGVALQELGQFDAAVASYDAAIALAPGNAEAHNNRGTALAALAQHEAAALSYGRAIALRPDYAEAHCNRGLALQKLGQLHAAIASHDQAIALRPDYAEAHNSRGLALQELGQLDAALQSYRKAIALKPAYADAHSNLGAALQRLKQLEAAVACYDRAIEIDPDDADVHYNRGVALQELAQLAQAEASYRTALRLRPDFGQARWALALVALPPLFAEAEDIAPSRHALSRALDELDAWFVPSRMNDAHEAVATGRLFYLAYQEADNKPLLSKYGALGNRLMRHWQQANAIAPAPLSAAGKIRLGIVSNHVCAHSVWTAIVKGLVTNLDPGQFELHVFHLGTVTDRETELAKSRAVTFAQGERPLARWAATIVEKRIEVLIYPEIGMHALTSQLASLRLAPIQLAMWGHPETTGLPTIDYYVSGNDLEPDDAEAFYTEKLVRLPHLGCHYSRQAITPTTPRVDGLDLRNDRPLLLCPGTTFKYMPQHDAVFAEIAGELRKCRFVFFSQQQQWTAILQERLRKAFRAAGLDVDDYVVFAPFLDKREFFGLMREADVFLDTIGFSGFNTAMQAVECRLPIVTRQGRFMRGRLASAILTRMGMPELVASTDQEYVRLAVRLAQDNAYRERIRSEMAERQSILFGDPEPIRALERFLIELCRPARCGDPPCHPRPRGIAQ